MAEQIRFHLDENVNLAVARGLRNLGIEVTTTPESGLLGAPDEEQLAYIVSERRVIFTQDTDFLIIASQTTAHRGIVFARLNSRSVGQIIQSLQLIHGVLTPEDMFGHIEYI